MLERRHASSLAGSLVNTLGAMFWFVLLAVPAFGLWFVPCAGVALGLAFIHTALDPLQAERTPALSVK